MRTYGAGVERARKKNATYTIHLEVLEGVSSETPTTRLLILLPAYIFMRGGGGGWERSTMEEEGLAWVSYYWINYPLVFIGCSVCFFSVSLDTLAPLRATEEMGGEDKEKETEGKILHRDTTGNSRGFSKYTELTTIGKSREIRFFT